MSDERINLAELRAGLAYYEERDRLAEIDPADAVALIDAVEAAAELEEAWAKDAVASGDLFFALPPEFVKLRETLARFDFGEPA